MGRRGLRTDRRLDWWGSIAARRVDMATATIRFVRIVEKHIATHLAWAQSRLALEPCVQFARIGVEALVFDLEAANSEHRFGNESLRIT